MCGARTDAARSVRAGCQSRLRLWAEGFRGEASHDVLLHPLRGGSLVGWALVGCGHARGMAEHRAQRAFALAVQFVNGGNVGVHGCLLGFGDRACRGLCEGRYRRKGYGWQTPSRAATPWRSRKDFRFAGAVALCQKRREKAAQAAAGGRRVRSAVLS